MIEAGVLISLENKPLYWHLPPGATVSSLPDDPDLWQVIWNNKDKIKGFAHSHPGSGITSPSYTDITTFSAIEIGLGRCLEWPITSSDKLIICRWAGPGKYNYKADLEEDEAKHCWLDKLRRISINPIEAFCEADQLPCSWMWEDIFDGEFADLYCEKCGRWRDFSKEKIPTAEDY